MQELTNKNDDFGLAEFDDDFSSAQIGEKEFEEPPDGAYQAIVDSVEMARSKERNLPMLRWKLKILGPRCAGRYLFRTNMIASAENLKWLKADLAICGMDVGNLRLSDLPRRLDELLDIKLEVQKKTRGEYANVYLNRRIHIDAQPRQAARTTPGDAGDILPF